MKKVNLLKGLVVILLSLVIVVSFTSIVFADENINVDAWETPEAATNTNTDDTTSNDTWANAIETSTNTNTNTNTEETNTNLSTNTGNATTTLNTNDTNEDNEVNSLAYTGIEDNSILAIAIVLGLIVAAYSFKKVREYNSL